MSFLADKASKYRINNHHFVSLLIIIKIKIYTTFITGSLNSNSLIIKFRDMDF